MIEVTIGTNTSRNTISVNPERTIKDVLESNQIRYQGTVLNLDGAPLGAGDINKTFAEMGVKDSCYLIAAVKADNA